MEYSSTTNYVMDQLAAQRGSNGKSWQEWLEEFNKEDEIDSSVASECAKVIWDFIRDPFGLNRVILWSDFDADGVTSAAILYECMKHYGNLDKDHIIVEIPCRINHGHGVSRHVIQTTIDTFGLAENTINTLLVVVDTGIEEVDGIKAFMEKVDHKTCKIVVIDHHSAIDAKRVPTEWMDASLLTYDLPMEHPCKELCGAGLSGLVHMEIAKLAEESEQDIEPLDTPYDLMALGTIADMVPILGVNRQIARIGLKKMNTGTRPGLDSLISQTIHSNVRRKGLTTESIAFNVAPKINAASRLGRQSEFPNFERSYTPFKLLTSNDNIKENIQMLLGINDQRKAWTERVWREADQTYRNTPGWAQANCAVVYGYWPMGILGIVANKFIDKYQVPSFLITDRKNSGAVWSPQHSDAYNNQLKGSARSPGNINLLRLMELSEELFEDYGGHQAAGGFVCKEGVTVADMIPVIASHVDQAQREKYEPVWNPDLIIPLSAVKYELITAQNEMEPTGYGNKYPVFEIRNLYASGIMEIRGGHVRFTVSNDSSMHNVNAIWFNPDVGYTLEGPFSMLCEIKEDNYRKQGSVQLLVRKIRR